jgi:hypothetical protein
MQSLYASCTPVILGCVLAELEKLGSRYAIARRIAKDERWRRIPCQHKGTYADDCIVRTVSGPVQTGHVFADALVAGYAAQDLLDRDERQGSQAAAQAVAGRADCERGPGEVCH